MVLVPIRNKIYSWTYLYITYALLCIRFFELKNQIVPTILILWFVAHEDTPEQWNLKYYQYQYICTGMLPGFYMYYKVPVRYTGT